MFGRIPQWSHLVLDICLQGDFFVCLFFVFFLSPFFTYFILLVVIGLFNLYVSSWFSFGGLFPETCLFFFLGCPIRWIIVHSILLFIYLFCGIGYYFPSLISYFVYLGPLSFILGDPDQRFVNFVYPYKKSTLGFIDFFLFFFKSLFHLFPLWSLLFPSLCWL